MLVFDIESDGLLDGITKVHCINMICRTTGREYRFTDHKFYQNVDGSKSDVLVPRDGNIDDALALLEEAEEIAGHHIIGYDVPALKIVYPYWPGPRGRQYDSKVASQLLYPDLKDKDWTNIRKGKLTEDFKKYAGSHSLFPWGIRIGGAAKQDFNPSQFGHTWKTMPFTQAMDDYCMDDVRANVNLIEHFESRQYSAQAVQLEMGVAKAITWQERVGIRFDYAAAERLAARLYARQYELGELCKTAFPPFWLKAGLFTPKRDNRALGYVAGAEVQKIELVEFNPSSRHHVALSLTRKYGWEPTALTDTGLPKIDDEILSSLPFPEAKQIGEYMMVQKRLSQLAEGTQAWMKKSKKDGRIYGRVDQLGTVTGRMSHFGPNLAQVPANHAPYGEDCRALFRADEGRVLVGCDADALELRVLAHFMARFDGGDYINTVLNGTKAAGTDIHTRNQKAIGLQSRDVAKTYFYAMLYGSGNFNLGTIVLTDWSEAKLTRFYKAYPPGNKRRSKLAALGKSSRAALMAGLPALGQLVAAVQGAAKRGHLKGLDGRVIHVRSMHAALNTLCQSAGAIVMKQALVLMFDEFHKQGLDVIPLLNVHDEVQLSTTEEAADAVGQIAAASIGRAGEVFNFRCPLAGNYDVGASWSETH